MGTKHSISRRGFLGLGALSAAGVATAGLSGCTPSNSDTEAAEHNAVESWKDAPAAISASKIVETVDADVVVVGAGNAGQFAACAAAEKGAKVVLLEKDEKMCTTAREWIGGIGSRYQQEAGVEIDKNKVVETLCFYASHRCDQRLIRTWADNSGATIDWLGDVVKQYNPDAYIKLETDVGNETGLYQSYPIQHNVQTDTEAITSLTFVIQKVNDLGVEVRSKTQMMQLERDDSGRVCAAIARNSEGDYVRFNASKGVIMCTGGYAANGDMMKEENPLGYSTNSLLSAYGSNTGDGIKAATWVGAAKQQQPTLMVFDRGGVPSGTPVGTAYQGGGVMFHMGSQPFLKVNHKGERFCNESVPYDFMTGAGTVQPGGTYCEIWDSNWKEQTRQFHTIGCSRKQYSPSGSLLMLMDEEKTPMFWEMAAKPMGVIVEADTLAELADKLMVPADTFVKTVERYNELCAAGDDQDFGKEAYRMMPLSAPPYMAATVGGQILCSLDGLTINTHMQVLDTDGEVIEGLYAAGNDSGGFFCNNYPELMVGSACGRTITFGRLAGQYAAQS